MNGPQVTEQLWNRLDVHDRRQLELKLEYQPSLEGKSHYFVEMFLFVPKSLNVDASTYPRQRFYGDLHNYVRLKTPMLGFDEMLASPDSPLVELERSAERGEAVRQRKAIYRAKLLCCIYRGALRRVVMAVRSHCGGPSATYEQAAFGERLEQWIFESGKVLERYRAWMGGVFEQPAVDEKTRTSLKLVDEYMSHSREKFLRRAAAKMAPMASSTAYQGMRKTLMAAVLTEERYRVEHRMRTVLHPESDNEEYMHRVSFLKKFCTNVLFLSVRREGRRSGWEEILFALAAGAAMAFATAVAFLAQLRFPQISLNFFLVLVVGYMMKDRIKEGLRRILSSAAYRHLFERRTTIVDPVTKRALGVCLEKLDYNAAKRVPRELTELRCRDDLITVAQGELEESVLRFQKLITLKTDMLPLFAGEVSGVTDIMRFSVARFLRDMDDPLHALEYVDLEDLTVGQVQGAKRYQIDVALQLSTGARRERRSLELYRLVLDRDGITRMLKLSQGPSLDPTRSPRLTAA